MSGTLVRSAGIVGAPQASAPAEKSRIASQGEGNLGASRNLRNGRKRLEGARDALAVSGGIFGVPYREGRTAVVAASLVHLEHCGDMRCRVCLDLSGFV